jgi:hypothetical protein
MAEEMAEDGSQVQSLEHALDGGAYESGHAQDSLYMKSQLHETALEKVHQRDMAKVNNDASIKARADVLRIFLTLVTCITIGGMVAFFIAPTSDQRNAGLAASVASLTAIGGLASGMGLK